MVGEKVGDITGLSEELILKSCKLAIKAHEKFPGKLYIYEKNRGSTDVVFAFAGSWLVDHWYSRKPFGETKVDASKFPSLRSLGSDEIALVNEAFSTRFEQLLIKSSFASEVEKAVSDRKQVVFTGHSSGGPMAILAAIWFLEKYVRPNIYQMPPYSVTFGSPLVGNRIFSHALRRENWARYFINFVMRHDIVPRIMLAPISSTEQGLKLMHDFTSPKSQSFQHVPIGNSAAAPAFFLSVMRNASSVASHAACNPMGWTNLLLETVSCFIEISPYRPFGTYIFCIGNGKLVVLDNPDAVLPLLFYCLQLSPGEENAEFLHGIFKEHLVYESELKESLNMQNVVYIKNLIDIPLSSDAGTNYAAATVNSALNDLGLSTRARLCLRAAGELEKQKLENQKRVDSNQDTIWEGLRRVQEYQTNCEIRKIGYYDAFRNQRDANDFNANVKRLELAGIWDEIMEMIKKYELPDGFEGRKEWIELGTIFRRLVEPLDIANYYRHLKNEDTGPYMVKARPKRYRYTQRWREQAEMRSIGSSSESTFWAEVEELRTKPYSEVKDKVLRLEGQAFAWIRDGILGKDVLLDESTFTKWWRALPVQHKSGSCIASYLGN
ncbi:Protein EDS1B [Forsythia ovata]|uniref:Protein EDS1B n=1 Tax=Forsythia ovata TaxID=205694 RepID=A0ABD1R2E2_9LAMI